MSRYLDPKADVVFKKIFGEHPHLLKSFLNAVLPLSADRQIVELTYLSPEQTPSIPMLKRTIADVRCVDTQGRVFIVEMQIEWTDSFKQRLLFEAGQAFVKQLKKGEEYHLLQPVYGLGLIATTFDSHPEQWYHHYQLVNIGKPAKDIIEHLQLVFIELPKFPIQSPNEKQLRLLWLRFMREINDETKTVSPELLNVPEISEALSLAEEAAYNPAELLAYETYWDTVSTEKTLIRGRYEEGLAEGLAAGLAKGETRERLMIAKNLLKQGATIDMIMQATGLPKTDIEKIGR
jgi:predicted transposase/invertase (TIGR01784 family)